MAEDVFNKFKEIAKNRITLLWGEPLVGKTSFAILLAKRYNNVVYIKLDKNITGDDIKQNLSDKNLILREINDIEDLFIIINQLRKVKPKDSLIVVDSISTLYDMVMEKYMENRPLAMNKYRDLLGLLITSLSMLRDLNNTIVIIGHARHNWKTGELEARLPNWVRKNIDLEIKMYLTQEGRKLEITHIRNYRNLNENYIF